MSEIYTVFIKEIVKDLSSKEKCTIGIVLAAGATFAYIAKMHLQHYDSVNI
jgi:hypothetical protein